MMPCSEFELFISMELDDALSEEETQLLQEHLQTCPQCRTVQAQLAQLQQDLGALSLSPPADLTQGVLDRIDAAESVPAVVPRPRVDRRMRRWAASAAALLLLASAAVFGGRVLSPTSSVDPSLAFDEQANAAEAQSSQDYALLEPAPESRTTSIEEAEPTEAAAPSSESKLPDSPSSAHNDATVAQAPEPQAPPTPAPATPPLMPPMSGGGSVPEESGPLLQAESAPEFDTGTAESDEEMLDAVATVPMTQTEAQALLEAYLRETPYLSLEAQPYDSARDVFPFLMTQADGSTQLYEVQAGDGSITQCLP